MKKGDIITVIGAGGKTSFINHFAKFYKNKAKVLLTTTTKIYLPDFYDEIFMLDECSNVKMKNDNGIVVCAKKINEDKKLIGLDFDDLDKIKDQFDLILIEGDGSKRKKIKGWNDTEPVIYNKTTKTVGIVDISAYNIKINDENIHRLDRFLKITKNNEKINLENFKDIVLHKNGMFKNAVGEKILFINKVENKEYENLALNLIDMIKEETNDIEIYYGSIKNNIYKR